jgi:hypothetical protein
MKRLLVLIVFALTSSLLRGSQQTDLLEPTAGPTPTLDELVRGLFASASGPRPQAASPGYGFDYAMLIPVIIKAPGRFGSDYVSDYFIANDRTISQDILAGFIAQGVSNVGQSTQRFTLNPNSIYSTVDILSYLGKSGLGSLLITAVQPQSNTIDTSAQIYGYALTYTKDPSTGGVNSFANPGVSPSLVHGPNDSIIIGVRQNGDFRTNYGVINLDTVNSQTFGVNFISGSVTPTTLTLPPLSMQHIAVPAIPATSNGYFGIDVRPTSSLDFRWFSYGVSANNLSGDAWISYGIQFRF